MAQEEIMQFLSLKNSGCSTPINLLDISDECVSDHLYEINIPITSRASSTLEHAVQQQLIGEKNADLFGLMKVLGTLAPLRHYYD